MGTPPDPADPQWKPLRQAWRVDGLESHFQPGWARVRWNETALLFDIVFVGRQPRNRARQLNERTWELGDIAEIFLQQEGSPEYIELHVTPENQRLQLRWTPEGFAAFRAQAATLEDFTIGDARWIESASQIGEKSWSVSARLPAAALQPGSAGLSRSSAWRGAVCRYDCTAGPDVTYSSTAPLRELSYHRREEWDRLELH